MKVILKIIELIIMCVLCFVIFAVVGHQTPEVLSLGFEDFAVVLGSQSQYYCFDSLSFLGMAVAFLFGVAVGALVLVVFLFQALNRLESFVEHKISNKIL